MLFLKIRNADILFSKKTLTWKSYIINKALSTTKQIWNVDLKEFVIVALNADSKTFVIHMIIKKPEKIPVNFEKQAQIKVEAWKKTQVRALLFDKALIKGLKEYSNYSNVFLVENVVELLENSGINEHIIKLKKGK